MSDITVTLSTEDVRWLEQNVKSGFGRKARQRREAVLAKLLQVQSADMSKAESRIASSAPHRTTTPRIQYGSLTFEVLEIVSRHPDGLTSSGVAEQVSYVNAASAAVLLSPLAKRGLIQVVGRGPGAKGKTANLYEITPKGRTALSESVKRGNA